MRIARSDIPTRLEGPGAVARQLPGFGDMGDHGAMGGEYFSLAAGTDISPLLKGLDGDLCQAPHGGYLLEGEVTATYADSSTDVVRGGDLFYWPPGHTVRVEQDAEVVLFSPADAHGEVIDHMAAKLAEMANT